MTDFIGLDIGSHTLKAVQIADGGRKRLVAFAQLPTPPKAVLASESEVDLKSLADALKQLIASSGFTTRNVATAPPESQIFTRVISLPKMTKKELATAVPWEAEQYIPIPLNEVVVDWEELMDKGAEGGKVEVLLVAAPKTLIEKIVKVLGMAGLKPLAIETETAAAVRSSVGEDPELPTAMVVNIGASTTGLFIISSGKVRFTRSIATGGTALARAISQELGFEIEQAEEYKKSYGLKEEELEGKILKAIKPIFEVIVAEVRRSLAFYRSHHAKDKVRRIVLVGGSASLPGAVVFMASSLGLETQLGDPWQGVEIGAGFDKKELEELGPGLAVAVGLALRNL